MPLPVTILSAAFAWIRARASGSISGLAGLLGQTWSVVLAAPWAALLPARAGFSGPGTLAMGVSRTGASGTTAWIAGFARSRLASGAEIVAEIALMMWKPCICDACSWRSSAITGFWAVLAALTRIVASAPRTDRLGNWFL